MIERRRRSLYRVRYPAVGAAACGVALALAACGSSSSGGSTGGGASAGAGGGSVSGKKVALISCTDSNPWCNGFNKTLEKGLAAHGVQLTTLTSNFSAAVDAQNFSQALSRQPNAILFYVNDQNAAIPSLAAAKRAGVKVVTVDTPVTGKAAQMVTVQLQANHTELGRLAAINIQEGLKSEGVKKGNVIMITGTQSETSVQDRIAGFKAQMAKTPQYKIVSIQDGNWDPILTGQIAQQLFAKYGTTGIQGAYGMADYQAAAISQAAAQAGIKLYPQSPKGLVVTGSNCAPTGVKAIESGAMYGGATQAPTAEANTDVPYILQVLEGRNVGHVIKAPVQRLTKANIAKYAKECSY
jgi:ABC-type sugar transport system substrate-binding protein